MKLKLGVLSDSLFDQITSNGVTVKKESLEPFEQAKIAIHTLRTMKIATESDCRQMNVRMHRHILNLINTET